MRFNLMLVKSSKIGISRWFFVGRIPLRVFIATCGLVAVNTPAYAYIDPGTGGMLLQLLLGGAAGALVIGKLYWLRIKEGFQSIFGGRTKPEDPSDSDTGN
ncbi:MAG: hypothetical protein OSB67_02295 [Alphaproteobacteria bacterium]|nr:hypothetical protein [Alphaproteobacteria bacterium]